MIERQTAEEVALEVRRLTEQLVAAGRKDLLLKAIGVSLLEDLRIEAARGKLSKLVITEDYRFILADYNNKEVELQPVHKAVYLLFLNHPEGIEFKRLAEYREELLGIYMKTARMMDKEKIEESVDKLVNPLDNAINEKCSRIKKGVSGLDGRVSRQLLHHQRTYTETYSRARVVRKTEGDYVAEGIGGDTLKKIKGDKRR